MTSGGEASNTQHTRPRRWTESAQPLCVSNFQSTCELLSQRIFFDWAWSCLCLSCSLKFWQNCSWASLGYHTYTHLTPLLIHASMFHKERFVAMKPREHRQFKYASQSCILLKQAHNSTQNCLYKDKQSICTQDMGTLSEAYIRGINPHILLINQSEKQTGDTIRCEHVYVWQWLWLPGN